MIFPPIEMPLECQAAFPPGARAPGIISDSLGTREQRARGRVLPSPRKSMRQRLVAEARLDSS